jgi:O-antigen/teichoic acid export membrane protein
MIIRAQLNIYNGAADVALFSVAYTLMEIVFTFVSTISATLSPYFFAEGANSGKPGLFYNIMLKYSVLSIMIIMPFLFVVRYDLIVIVASAKYYGSGDYVPLLIMFPLLRVLIIVFDQYFLKNGHTIYLGIIYLVGITVAFLLSILLIPRFSIQGAIYVSLISYSIIFISLYVKQHKIMDFAYLNLKPLLLLGAILVITVFLLSYLEIWSFYKILPLGTVMLLCLYFVPVLSDVEKNKIIALLKFRKT